MPHYQRPTGTLDTLPEDQHYWYHVRARARHLAELVGFERIDLPIFEATELFARGVGEGTDIVDRVDVRVPRWGILLEPLVAWYTKRLVLSILLDHKRDIESRGT